MVLISTFCIQSDWKSIQNSWILACKWSVKASNTRGLHCFNVKTVVIWKWHTCKNTNKKKKKKKKADLYLCLLCFDMNVRGILYSFGIRRSLQKKKKKGTTIPLIVFLFLNLFITFSRLSHVCIFFFVALPFVITRFCRQFFPPFSSSAAAIYH